jgi:hypothetical protein
MDILNHNNSLFASFSGEGFFSQIKNKLVPTDTIADALSFRLISRDGETAFANFRARIEQYWPDYAAAWREACESLSFSNLPQAVRLFINRIKSDDIVDEEYPLFLTIGNPKNSFCDVRLLKSLSVLCTDEVMAPNFLYFLAQGAPADPLNYLNYTALSQLLLERGVFGKAANFALEAKRLRANDLCVSKTIVSTQKALLAQGLKPDINHAFSDKRDLFCEMPFKVLSIFQYVPDHPLSFFMCQCRAWAPAVFDSNFSWNGADAQEFRHSILDGSFRYCDELACPFLKRNSLPTRAKVSDPHLREIIDNNTVMLDKGPRDIILAYDRSCNLSCPSCRAKPYMADKPTTEFYNKTVGTMLPPLLSNAKSLDLSQTGEALVSPHFRHLLKSINPSKYPDLQIKLLTNLKLVSQKTWTELGEISDSIKTLRLSIDGATPKTLEKLRRGLKWDRMLDALNFIRNLRRSSKLDFVPVNFIIQKDNFRELPKMLELCSFYGLDSLQAARICSHGSYTNDQFRDIDVGDPAHILHTAYIAIIKQTVALHKEMEENATKILASGRSVPVFMSPPI